MRERQRRYDTQIRKGNVKTEAEDWPQPKNASSHWKLDEARKRFFQEPLEPSFQPHDADFRLLISRIVSEYILDVSKHQICGNIR